MSKSRRNRNNQSSDTPSAGNSAKPLVPAKLPPLDDPSWKQFAERHERFMARHPGFEALAEEQFRTFSQPSRTEGTKE